IGVGRLGLPMDAGIVRATCPSMLTVKVCAEMSATPTTAAPVVMSVLNPPTDSSIVVCAGQNSSGLNCRVSALSHSNFPVRLLGAAIVNARSTAARLATGSVKVSTTGAPTPTTSPGRGCTDATTGSDVVTAADPGLVGPTSTVAATVNATSAHLVSKRMPPFTRE